MPKKAKIFVILLILLLGILLAFFFLTQKKSDQPVTTATSSNKPKNESVFKDLSNPIKPDISIESDDYKVEPVYPLKVTTATVAMAKILGGDPDTPEDPSIVKSGEPPTSVYDRIEALGLIWGSVVSWEAPNIIRIRLNTRDGINNTTEHTFQCGDDTAFFDGRNNIRLIDTGFDFISKLRKKSMIYASCTNDSCTELGGPCIVVWN